MSRTTTRLLAASIGAALLCGGVSVAHAAPAKPTGKAKAVAEVKELIEQAAPDLPANFYKRRAAQRGVVRNAMPQNSTLATSGGTASATAAAVSVPAEGSFANFDGKIFKIVGGATLFVSTWANVPRGTGAVTKITEAQYLATNQWPVDGTFVRTTEGKIYEFVGGAPIYVSSWIPFGGARKTVAIDTNDVKNAGADYPWDGVSDWTVDYNLATFDSANGIYDFNGNLFIRGTDGRIYKQVSGAPVFVADPKLIKKTDRVIQVDSTAVKGAGGKDQYRFLAKHVVDGWSVRGAQTGQVFLTAGGAPIAVGDPALLKFGWTITPSNIDAGTITDGGKAAPKDNLRYRPVDGTYLEGLDTAGNTHYYQVVNGGHPTEIAYEDIPATASLPIVHQSAITNAGGNAPWDHLLALQ